jgi:sec-independent protein translocase protein TatA
MPVTTELFLLGIMGIGTTELIIFGIIVLVVFGSSRLPTLMRSLGRSANEFKAGLKDPVSDFKDEVDEAKKD